MSYILNALRKSDQIRQAKQGEMSGHPLLEKQEESENKKDFPWLIFLASINICLLAYFILSTAQERDKPAEIKKAVVVDKTQPSAPNKTMAFIKPSADLAKEHQKTSIAKRIKKEKERINERRKAKEIIRTMAQDIYVDSNGQRASDVKIKSREPLIVLPKQNATNIKEGNIPFLSALSYEFRRTVPSININVFVYTDNEEGRFIMVDMKRYQEGQDVEEGVTLKEIRKNSIVVEYSNRIFQIKR